MSAFKSLTSQDVIVVPFVVNKSFTFNPKKWVWNNVSLDDYGIRHIDISKTTATEVFNDSAYTDSTQYYVKMLFEQNAFENADLILEIYDGYLYDPIIESPSPHPVILKEKIFIPAGNYSTSFNFEFSTISNIITFKIYDPTGIEGPFGSFIRNIDITPNYGIDRLIGKNILSTFEATTEPITGNLSTRYQRDIYNSVKQLYYTNELPNPEGIRIVYDYQGNIVENNTNTNVHSRFDNYLNTTLSGSRPFPTASNAQIGVISISSNFYGDYINPGSFYFRYLRFGSSYANIVDDKEGRLIVSGSNPNTVIGSISYQHGLAIITNLSNLTGFTSSIDVTCSFQSTRLIYETQYKCTIRENEFNYTLNPSIISGSNFTNPLLSSSSLNMSGQVYDFVTGSVFAPYVTTVGLYNENQELLAVAKLSQPLPTSRTTDTSILINIDR